MGLLLVGAKKQLPVKLCPLVLVNKNIVALVNFDEILGCTSSPSGTKIMSTSPTSKHFGVHL